ncbi:MAG: hypothetical protein RR390_18145 [Hafnia sp.]
MRIIRGGVGRYFPTLIVPEVLMGDVLVFPPESRPTLTPTYADA